MCLGPHFFLQQLSHQLCITHLRHLKSRVDVILTQLFWSPRGGGGGAEGALEGVMTNDELRSSHNGREKRAV